MPPTKMVRTATGYLDRSRNYQICLLWFRSLSSPHLLTLRPDWYLVKRPEESWAPRVTVALLRHRSCCSTRVYPWTLSRQIFVCLSAPDPHTHTHLFVILIAFKEVFHILSMQLTLFNLPWLFSPRNTKPTREIDDGATNLSNRRRRPHWHFRFLTITQTNANQLILDQKIIWSKPGMIETVQLEVTTTITLTTPFCVTTHSRSLYLHYIFIYSF